MKQVLILVFCSVFVFAALATSFAGGTTEAKKTGYTLGISNYRDSFEFCAKVHKNIEEWAAKYGFKTVYAEANMDAEKMKANLDTFALQKVDAIFEFNWLTDVTAKFVKENPQILVVTGDYVVPGAYYFGANQYVAGQVLGRYLADNVKKRWNGSVDAFIFAACYQCGELLQSRMNGILDGFKETYPSYPDAQVFKFENQSAEGQIVNTKRIVTDFVTAHPNMNHIVVGTNNDEGGLGALQAVETMGKESNFFIVSHGGDTPFQDKIRAGKGDVWIGSVAYTPEKYGEFMIPWLKNLLDKKAGTPKEMNPKHFVLTKDNIDQYYPVKK
jgi:ribose transport system substrate-binding protein